MTFAVETFDNETSRRVKHQTVRADILPEAVYAAVGRRYRLREDVAVLVSVLHGSTDWAYAEGTYVVIFDGYPRPAYAGTFVANRA